MLNIRDFGAIGDGVHDDLPAFRIALASVHGALSLCVPAGTYAISDVLEIGKNNALSCGDGPEATVLLHTGSGAAVSLQSSGFQFGSGLRGLTIAGNSATTHGLILRNADHGHFSDISIRDIPNGEGVTVLGGVCNTFERIRITTNEPAAHTNVGIGIRLDGWNNGSQSDSSQANSFRSCIIEGCNIGVQLDQATFNTFSEGTIESGKKGIVVGQFATANRFANINLEANVLGDVLDGGALTVLDHLLAVSAAGCVLSGHSTQVLGGYYSSIRITGPASAPPWNVWLERVVYGQVPSGTPAGAIIDQGLRTTSQGCRSVMLVNSDPPKIDGRAI